MSSVSLYWCMTGKRYLAAFPKTQYTKFTTAYTHFQKKKFSRLYTQIQQLHTQNAKCFTSLAKWSTAFKYHKHISKANICKHLCHKINSCSILFVCYIENCVLCFAKSVLWKSKAENWCMLLQICCVVWVSGFRNCVTSKDFVCKQLKPCKNAFMEAHVCL